MQPDDDPGGHHDDPDSDSLFGSPPPSPGRGRSVSPTLLALPSSAADITQNVGTLALPGSHLCSELPLALPPVLSMSAPQRPRLPRTTSARQQQQPPSASSSASAVPLASRSLEARASSVQHQHKKRPSRRSTPANEHQPPPSIRLPSPDEPVPPNFLRNQDGLLGHAGLVAGVRPADLAFQRTSRGQTPSNPIIIEEDDAQPRIGRRPVPNRLSSQPGSLPIPSYEEIIHTLVKQKNLVPVMDALLRIVTGSALPSLNAPATSSQYPYTYGYPYGSYQPPPQPSAFTSRIARAPKRRRLNSVPAGASDWDVPFPFAEGQGPPNYKTNWERERGRQLIEDLVGLVKSAAKKAAAKKAVEVTQTKAEREEEEHAIGSVEYYRQRVLRHYQPQSQSQRGGQGLYQQKWAQGALLGGGEGGAGHHLNRPRAATTPSACPQPMQLAFGPLQTPAVTPSRESQISAPGSSAATLAVPEAVVSLDDRSQSEPPLPSGFPFPLTPNSTSNEGSTTTNLDDFLKYINDLPVGDLDALFSADFSSLSASEGATPIANNEGPDLDALFNFDLDSSTAPDPHPDREHKELVIDPLLLAISGEGSASGNGAVQNSQAGASPTVGSPLSLSDIGPPTPQWEVAFPEPEIAVMGCEREGGGGDGGGDGIDSGAGGDTTEGKGKERAVDVSMGEELRGGASSTETSRQSTPGPVAAQVSVPVPPPTTLPTTTTYAHHLTPFLTPTFSSHSQFPFPFPLHPSTSRTKPPNRDDVLARARTMRAQLAEEVARAKVELWETTMEGGCLGAVNREVEKLCRGWAARHGAGGG